MVHLNKPVSFPILNTICLCAQAQAEETLNTLHFASMALRVKCNPLCILDPQDKLVLNLRGTISKLRSQNKQLSTALQRSRSHSGDGSDPDFEHEPVSVCNVVALHWYTIQRIRLGNTLARGLVSSLDQVVFSPIRYSVSVSAIPQTLKQLTSSETHSKD